MRLGKGNGKKRRKREGREGKVDGERLTRRAKGKTNKTNKKTKKKNFVFASFFPVKFPLKSEMKKSTKNPIIYYKFNVKESLKYNKLSKSCILNVV